MERTGEQRARHLEQAAEIVVSVEVGLPRGDRRRSCGRCQVAAVEDVIVVVDERGEHARAGATDLTGAVDLQLLAVEVVVTVPTAACRWR